MTAKAQFILVLVTLIFWATAFSMCLQQIDQMPLPNEARMDCSSHGCTHID